MSEGSAPFLKWWRTYLRPVDDNASARALRARLRRADGVLDVLSEPQIHALVADRPDLAARPHVLAVIVMTLAIIERHESPPLARRLGHGGPEQPAMSKSRFEKLMRASREELRPALRRALAFVEESCNVERLARDILDWDDPHRGEAVRIAWWFDYFRVEHAARVSEQA